LETGKIILEGKAAELPGNDHVRQEYLGDEGLEGIKG